MAAYEAEGQQEPFIPADTFAVRLIMIRKELGLTQAEAAQRCGFDDGSWSNWENGTRPRGLDIVVEKISSNLGVDRDWLMWGGSQNRKFLISVPEPVGQGSLLDADLLPLDFYSRADLALV